MKTGKCPECAAFVEVQDKSIGNTRGMKVHDIVDCDECGAELKIMALDPLVEFNVVTGNYEIEVEELDEMDIQLNKIRNFNEGEKD